LVFGKGVLEKGGGGVCVVEEDCGLEARLVDCVFKPHAEVSLADVEVVFEDSGGSGELLLGLDLGLGFDVPIDDSEGESWQGNEHCDDREQDFALEG